MPSSAWSRVIRARICAWIVTSRAVVGSSAISTSGSRRAPSQSSPAGASRPRTRGGSCRSGPSDRGSPPGPGARCARLPRHRLETSWCAASPRRAERRPGRKGCSEVRGSWKIIAISLPRTWLEILVGGGGEVGPLVHDPTADFGVRAAGEPEDREVATLLPHPDSPTIPRVSPRSTPNDTPSTACTTPSSVWKLTLRSLISSRHRVTSLVPDPRVEIGISDVDDQVEDDDEEGPEQGAPWITGRSEVWIAV